MTRRDILRGLAGAVVAPVLPVAPVVGGTVIRWRGRGDSNPLFRGGAAEWEGSRYVFLREMSGRMSMYSISGKASQNNLEVIKLP